jgi:hypothetical protein
MASSKFEHLSPFLRYPEWEATNNGAERMGRAFRHQQAPHFNLRSQEAIAGSLVIAACKQKEAATQRPIRKPSRCLRGRKKQPSLMAPSGRHSLAFPALEVAHYPGRAKGIG